MFICNKKYQTEKHLDCVPLGVSVDVDINRIYVSCIDQSSILVIDGLTNKIIKSIPVPPYPGEIGVNPYTHAVIVAHSLSNLITIINGTKDEVTSIIPTMDYSILNYVSIDPKQNIAYIVRTYSNNILPLNLLLVRFCHKLILTFQILIQAR